MKIQLHATEFCLSKGQGLRIVDGRGHRIVCNSGCIWITQEGDVRDFLLQQNESLTLAKNATIYISPIRHATLAVEAAEHREARFMFEAIRAAFRSIFEMLIHGRSAT